jgi:hypothetical protein
LQLIIFHSKVESLFDWTNKVTTENKSVMLAYFHELVSDQLIIVLVSYRIDLFVYTGYLKNGAQSPKGLKE